MCEPWAAWRERGREREREREGERGEEGELHVNVTDTLLLCVITDVYNVHVSCIFHVKIILFFTV